MKRWMPLAWIAAGAWMLFGCSGVNVNTPAGFAEIDDDDTYAYRATSAEGVVLAVREEANDPRGNLDFWSSAVRYELERKGYTSVDKQDVRSPGGVEGRQMRYRTTRNGRPNVLWVTVFVTDGSVFVVEAGGDVAHFERVEKAVDEAVRGLDLG